MDIEGNEMAALDGAKNTINSFMPELAVCIYHKASDLIDIPKKINEINEDYVFFIKHNSNNFWETVLFAKYEPNFSRNKKISNTNENRILSNIWKYVFETQYARVLNKKKDILKKINQYFIHIIDYSLQPVFDTNGLYVYYPLSSNKNLHYEFYFPFNEIEISLHFEGDLSVKTDIIKEICNNSHLRLPLLTNTGKWAGCHYALKNYNDYEYAAKLMNYLIEISLPILHRENLLKDDFLLNTKTLKNIVIF